MKIRLSRYCDLRRTWLAILAVTFLSFVANLPAAMAEEAMAEETAVLLFGDSIAAGFGLPVEDGLAAQLQAALRQEGFNVTMLGAGVSGDTTAGGRARLDWALTPEVQIIVIVLGGNDALRAISPQETRDNLTHLIAAAKAKGLKIVLTGMRAPPNLGAEYAAEFEPIYAELAELHQVTLYPFILEGVAADPALNQTDGIHPNAEGVKVIVAGLIPLVANLIEDKSETE